MIGRPGTKFIHEGQYAAAVEVEWLESRTVMKKYRSEINGRRSFDTAVQYRTAATMATEKTRTAKAAVRATRLPCALHPERNPAYGDLKQAQELGPVG